jgi:hypothetical protein
MAAKSRALEKIMARYRHRDLPEPRPRPRPQGSFSRQLQLQKNREGFLRRRHAAAITAARYEAKEAMVKAEVLLDKMKTMEATLSRVAAMLPSLERMQRREDAAAAKIQAALRGYAKRKALRVAVHKANVRLARRAVSIFFLRHYLHRFSRHYREHRARRLQEVMEDLGLNRRGRNIDVLHFSVDWKGARRKP